MLGLACVVTCLVVIISYSLYWRFSHAGRLMAKIPSITGRCLPVVGNMFDFVVTAEELFQLMRRSYAEHGGITKMWAFQTRYVNVYDPEDFEKVLSTPKFNEKQDPYTFVKPWLCGGLLISNGDKWQRRRKILTPAFHFNILRQFSHSFVAHTERLLAQMDALASVGAAAGLGAGGVDVDLVPLLSRATLTIMCETSMGISSHEGLDSVSEKYFYAIQTMGKCLVHRLSRVWLYPWRVFRLTGTARLMLRTVKVLHAFTDKIIAERRRGQLLPPGGGGAGAAGAGRGALRGLALLDVLLASAARGDIDALGVREEVDTFMFEGHDTTARALCYTLMCIANEPEVQAELFAEQQRVVPGWCGAPSPEQLAQMRYLEACIKEALRLYPSVPYIARYLHEDVMLGGHLVPAGTVANLHIFDLHRRADLFPQPLRFLPRRHLPPAPATPTAQPAQPGQPAPPRHPYAYVPFSAGPRNCIGQKFAMLELKTLVSGVVRRFELRAVTRPTDLEFAADMTLRTTRPVRVRLLPRLAAAAAAPAPAPATH